MSSARPHREKRDNQNIHRWSALKPGDIVDVVAPGSACRPDELKRAVDFIKSWDLVPRVPKDLFQKVSPICSNSDEKRFLFLKQALLAKDSKVIWCIRGGYGSLRLMPRLSRMKAPRQSKLVIGYSDITTLHSYLNFQWQWPSIHGPLLERFGNGQNQPRETRELQDLIFGRLDKVVFKGLKPMNEKARESRQVRSSVVGGNMAVIQSSLGTPWQMQAKGRILFFEDIGERPHRVDRMLVQLSQAGLFKGIRGIVFGNFLLSDPADSRMLWKDVLVPFAKQMPVPVLKGLPAGHGAVQRPVPLMTSCQLQLGEKASLLIESGCRE